MNFNLPPLVEIGLTDLPKFGGAMAPPAPPGTASLVMVKFVHILVNKKMWQNYYIGDLDSRQIHNSKKKKPKKTQFNLILYLL